MRRSDSPAHLLVRRGAVRIESDLRRAGAMHDLHGCRNIGCRGARCQLRRSSQWSGTDDLRGTRGACERILVHGMLFGLSGRGIAKLARCLVIGREALLRPRVLGIGLLPDEYVVVGVFPKA